MGRDGTSLKARAVVFALVAGSVAFVLAVVPHLDGTGDATEVWQGLIPAIAVAALCWAAAERALGGTASAIDAAIERLARGARGDLDSAVPATVDACVPALGRAMRDLFTQLGVGMASIERMAMFDAVTQLPNRSHFRTRCDAMLAELEPPSESALLFIDLDRFKHVNDTLGHAAGDMVLAEVANRLRAVVADGAPAGGAPPLVGRLAGDEFTVFLPRIDHADDAEVVAEAILRALAEPFVVVGQQVTIGASAGLALRPHHGRTLSELMTAADTAMYSAKAAGRGRLERFGPALAERIDERASLDAQLRRAVTHGDFSLQFQPQVAPGGGGLVAAEALLRWEHPQDGPRRPGSFLARAEENGLILDIGEWVIDEVAATIARWERSGNGHRLAINLSQRQLDHADFFHRLQAAMLAAGAPIRLLELELSETLAMTCSDEVVAVLTELRDAGATIAIDNFGTGYFNVGRLRALPIGRIKLDRSLTTDIVRDADARAIVQALIGLIHGLGCAAAAEGIEHPAQAELLRVAGCDAIQGYAVAPPMDETDYLSWARGSAILESSAA